MFYVFILIFKRQYSVGFEVTCIHTNVENQTIFNKKSTGDFRKGFCVLELENISGGIYLLSISKLT